MTYYGKDNIFQLLFSQFKLDEIDIDNWNFKLHSKVTVGIFMMASAGSIATGYFGDPIECKVDAHKSFVETYCWTHGSYHIQMEQLETQINQGESCFLPPS